MMLSPNLSRVRLPVSYGCRIDQTVGYDCLRDSFSNRLSQVGAPMSSSRTGQGQVMAHFCRVSSSRANCEPDAIARFMQEKVGARFQLRDPQDIREVIALGALSRAEVERLIIPAPRMLSPLSSDSVFKLLRFPAWAGLMPATWGSTSDLRPGFDFVRFSDLPIDG